MNKHEFEGNWHQFKGKIQEKWGKLTNDDIAKCNGKYEQLLHQIEKKYGYSREQCERELKNLCGSCKKEEHPKDKLGNHERKNIHELDPKHKNKDSYQDKKDKHRKAS